MTHLFDEESALSFSTALEMIGPDRASDTLIKEQSIMIERLERALALVTKECVKLEDICFAYCRYSPSTPTYGPTGDQSPLSWAEAYFGLVKEPEGQLELAEEQNEKEANTGNGLLEEAIED